MPAAITEYWHPSVHVTLVLNKHYCYLYSNSSPPCTNGSSSTPQCISINSHRHIHHKHLSLPIFSPQSSPSPTPLIVLLADTHPRTLPTVNGAQGNLSTSALLVHTAAITPTIIATITKNTSTAVVGTSITHLERISLMPRRYVGKHVAALRENRLRLVPSDYLLPK